MYANRDSTINKKELRNILDTELVIRQINFNFFDREINAQSIIEEPAVVLIHTRMQTMDSPPVVEKGSEDALNKKENAELQKKFRIFREKCHAQELGE